MTAHHAQRAYAAIQKALSLIDRASSSEKALIEAMGVRYAERFDAEMRITPQDRAYVDAMSSVAAAYPADLDIATLYAEALFLLLPRPGMQDLENPTVSRLLAVLEAALKRDIRHPGACHLYIHTTELTSEPERAVACASIWETRFPAPATSITCPRTPGARWADGGMPFRPAFRRGNPIRRRPKTKGLRPTRRTTCRCWPSPPRWTDRVRWRSRPDAVSQR